MKEEKQMIAHTKTSSYYFVHNDQRWQIHHYERIKTDKLERRLMGGDVLIPEMEGDSIRIGIGEQLVVYNNGIEVFRSKSEVEEIAN